MKRFTDIPSYTNRCELIRAIVSCGTEPWLNKTSWVPVGDEMGATANAVRKQYNRLVAYLGKNDMSLSEFVEHALGNHDFDDLEADDFEITTSSSATDDNKYRQTIENMGYDPEKYDLVPRSVWSGGGDNVNHSFKVVRKTDGGINVDESLSRIATLMNRTVKKVKGMDDGAMAMFSLYDPHFGKKTLGTTSDVVDAYKMVLTELVERVAESPGFTKRPVLVIGQDYVNYDNAMGTTTAGTPQDNTLSWKELIDTQIAVAMWSVELLYEWFGRADIYHVPGNHDMMQNYWLLRYLQQAYSGVENINVNGGGDYVFIREGDVGIMVAHGHVGKAHDYLDLWASESPETFTAPYKEIYTGHLHTRKEVLVDKKGVVHRYMPGLTAPDQWHKDKLYIRNNRLGIATVYNSTRPVEEYYGYVEDND